MAKKTWAEQRAEIVAAAEAADKVDTTPQPQHVIDLQNAIQKVETMEERLLRRSAEAARKAEKQQRALEREPKTKKARGALRKILIDRKKREGQ